MYSVNVNMIACDYNAGKRRDVLKHLDTAPLSTQFIIYPYKKRKESSTKRSGTRKSAVRKQL